MVLSFVVVVDGVVVVGVVVVVVVVVAAAVVVVVVVLVTVVDGVVIAVVVVVVVCIFPCFPKVHLAYLLKLLQELESSSIKINRGVSLNTNSPVPKSLEAISTT